MQAWFDAMRMYCTVLRPAKCCERAGEDIYESLLTLNESSIEILRMRFSVCR